MPPRPATTATKDEPPTGESPAPRLRFAEFAGRPIRSLTLGEVTEDCTDRKGTTATGLPIMGVSKTDGIVPMEERLIGKDTARYKRLEPNWFAYNPMRLNIGSIARWKGDRSVLVSPDYVVFRCVVDGANALSPDYLDHFRSSMQWEDLVAGSGDGGVRVRIYYKDLAQLRLGLPHINEQQKIANCLTSLDEVIAAQGRKVEALKAHKKGLMQHLFPQEGQTLPRLRFPEFRDGPEWERETVGSRTASFSGGTPDTANKDFYGGTIPFIRSAEIAKPSTELFLSEAGLEASAAKMVSAGDVLVALYGANSGDVALSRVTGAINQAILCLRPKGSKAFLYHALSERQPWILATFIQGGQGNLSGEIVKSIPLRFPSPSEQEAVAECLCSIDALIHAAEAKLVAVIAHKNGLMQQLFPAPPRD